MGQTPLSIGEQRELERASVLADSYVQAASAQATERAYDRDFADFRACCSPLGLEPLPAEPSTVTAYPASLADTGLKASTIWRQGRDCRRPRPAPLY